MNRVLLLALAFFLAACSNQVQPLELQEVDTAGFVVVSTPINNGNDNCKLEIAESNGVLVVRVADPINACDKASTDFIPFTLVHRDEAVDSESVFSQSGVKPFSETPVRRFFESHRVWSVYQGEYALPDSTVHLIPDVRPFFGCYGGRYFIGTADTGCVGTE